MVIRRLEIEGKKAYRVESESVKPNGQHWNLGTYSTLAAAKKRLAQIERIKHAKHPNFGRK
jgi:hypothetical protein